MKKILVAIDSFKGCMTSHEANVAACEGLTKCFKDIDVQAFDVSDGGEGFLEAMRPDEIVRCHVHDALMRWVDSAYGIKDGKAVIEVAKAVGLTMIEPEQRIPLVATSYGVGELMTYAYNRGCREFIIGLGGSATSDCGLGMLKCLKHTWQTVNNKMWYDAFDTSWLHNIKVILATDVTNPLCGDNGAAHVFAPQKGADDEMVEKLERRARTFAAMAARHQGFDMSNEPGAGAAGGLAYAFMQFMDARTVSGADLVLQASGFDDALDGRSVDSAEGGGAVSLVVTGEGSSDAQTLMGKLPSVILRHAKAKDIPVVLLAGKVKDRERLLRAGFSQVININEGCPEVDNPLDKNIAEKRLGVAFEHHTLQFE